MKRVRPPPDPADQALFRAAVGPVRPLAKDTAERRPTPPRPHPTQTLRDAAAVVHELAHAPIAALEPEMSEPLSYLREGASPKLLRRIGRGEFAVGDELDLHHMTAAVATDAIARFLDESRRSGRLCVRIIHGKGLRSKAGGPVLKRLTDRLLRRRGDVLAFRSARAADGGSGAVVVLLRRDR